MDAAAGDDAHPPLRPPQVETSVPQPVAYTFADLIATLTLDDGKANVMGLPMLAAINAALDRAQADRAKVVVLRGRPGMFSGGFDLAVFKRSPADTLAMLHAGALLTERLLSLPVPVLAVCTGHAMAMGAFLLLSADVRVGVNAGSRVQANEVQIGMTLPYFAIQVCRMRLSPPHLNLAACTAQPYTPEEAVAAGFLDLVVPAEALDSASQAQVQRLAGLNAEAFAATKQRLRKADLQALRQAIEDDLLNWRSRFSG